MTVPPRLQSSLADRYRIERELGAGGMATVYLAQDLKHDRKVAIKVLRPELAAVIGADRFLSEIKTTANLQHPHILPLHDSGQADSFLFYVMPFVEGESLRDRLHREKQLPIPDAVRIATEVAGALDYAHRHGIIHRDIKPENILLHDGRALVADFGIALAATSAGHRMTETGMSLGTPHYMSPEQAMGDRELTPRSDVYALGAMTYEMLLGEPPFTGPTAQSIVAKVMTEKPARLMPRRDRIPQHVEDAVLTALEKLPADRFGSAAEFAEALADDARTQGRKVAKALPPSRPPVLARVLIAALSVIAIGATAFAIMGRRTSVPARVGRFALAFPAGQELLAPGGTRFAWSPDGQAFVYTGPGKGRAQLWLRRLDELQATPIPGTEGATSPVFSPDGKEIGFLTLSPFVVKVASLSDGQTRTILDQGASGGGLAWSDNGYLYADGGTGLVQVRQDGSDRKMVLSLDTLKKEAGVAWPTALPGGRGVLVRIRSIGDAPSDYRIVALDLRKGSRKELIRGQVARYSPTGHLLWVTADGALHAQRFDLDRLELAGTAVSLWNGLAVAGFGASDLALSPAGDLLYVPGVIRTGFSELSWVTRDGARVPVDSAAVDGLIGSMALSPDGSAVALEILRSTDASNLSRVWVKRLGGGPTQLVTSENRSSFDPVWTPNGRDLVFSSDDGGIYRRRADGSGSAEPLARAPQGAATGKALHRDGKTLVLQGNISPTRHLELLKARLGTDTTFSPLLATSGRETSPAFSPDGRAIAYVSSETGRPEVYVRPFPDVDSRKLQVSAEGGAAPRWSPRGGELFYISGAGDMMAARVEASPALKVNGVTRLFTPIGFQGGNGALVYDVSPDGKRFLMLDITAAPGNAASERIVLVQHLDAELGEAAAPMSEASIRLGAALSDRYRIERELGQGGMATVYLAEDLKHDRKVALKVLKPELGAVLGAERFLSEIKVTAALQHPHILPLFDSGSADGFLYYVMPFIDGETLRDKLARERQLDLADALELTRQVASALAYAHERGVVHRDIKPENILLSGGHALVADFGIARAVGAAGGEQLTATGMAIGTPAYMSPEQSAGMSDVDGRSDTYALASVLYEMLAGEPPFTGQTAAAVIAKRLGTIAPSARVLRETVPRAVDQALQRALQRAPADRYASATEFAAALGAGARTAGRRMPWRAVIAVIVLLVIGTAAWLGLRGRGNDGGLDADVIAVLPFRVGGNPSIGYLRESMLDLLQARLTGTPRTVEPRTVLAAWRQAVGSDKEDLSEAASRTLARRLGAGRVLLGSAIATPTELTLSGSLIRVADGKVLAREQAAGAPDSIAVLVNRLTAALLIGESGETQERSAGLAGAPLDALQNYLAGRKASRRGDYFGAMDLYGRAFARDSTFADAAFAMVTTNAWIGTVFATAGWQVVPLVARLRSRLGARDLALFLALPMVGPNYPRPSSLAEVLAQAERATDAAADSPEHWLLLGQLLSRYGAAASRVEWATRSAEALDRAIALDSSFTLAVSERLYTAMAARDSGATARYSRLLEGRVTSGFTDDFYLWAAAHSLGDTAAARRWRNRATGLSRTDVMQKLVKMTLHSAALALPLDDARWAVDTLERAAKTVPERVGAGLGRLALRFAEGRADLGDVNSGVATGAQWAGTMIQQALIEPVYRAIAATILAQEAAGQYRLSSAVGANRWPPVQDCFGTLYRVAGGDTSGAVAAVRRLRAFAASEPPPISRDEWEQVDFRVCPLLLEAMLGNRPALERLDSLLREDPRGFTGSANVAPAAFANFTVARLREAQGNLPAALAAIRRREVDYFPAYLWSLPAFLRQEGRLAALTGDTTGAIRAYDQYLTLRTNPDAPFKPQRDSVIAERAALARRIAR